MNTNAPDLSTDECKRLLRRMELEAYSNVVTAFRAQGELNEEKQKLMQELCRVLKVSGERHKAEMRRAANDDHLAAISRNLTGEESGTPWVLEGRRVVPLMPRLVPPTLFTSLATTVSNLAGKNPLIYRSRECARSLAGESVSKHTRDPDEEDTLSPVMVPALSPEGTNNNNVETSFSGALTRDGQKEFARSSKPAPLILTPRKRARSPSASMSSGTLQKTQAMSAPSAAQGSLSAAPRGVATAPAPRLLLFHQPRGPVPVSRGITAPTAPSPARVRIRGPVPQPPAPRVEPPRPVIITPVASRTPMPRVTPQGPVQPQFQPMSNQVKIVTRQPIPVAAAARPAVPAALGEPVKTAVAKPNVIVLHRSIATNEESVAVAKPVSTIAPTVKRKVIAAPNNVRIITVPTSTAPTAAAGAAAASTGITVKSSTPNTQGNVIVLDLSAEQLSKTPLVLSDILQSPQFIKEVNGALAPNAVTKVQTFRNLAKTTETPSADPKVLEEGTETNGNHIIIETVEENVVTQNLGDSQIEFIYANGDELMTVEQTVDIFGTLSSAELNLNTISTDEGSHLIIQDESGEQIPS